MKEQWTHSILLLEATSFSFSIMEMFLLKCHQHQALLWTMSTPAMTADICAMHVFDAIVKQNLKLII